MTFKPYSTEGFIYQAPGGGRGTRVSDDLDTIKANFMHLEKLLIASSNPPFNPRVGQLWFDASTNQLKKWNGSEWVGISVDAVDGFHASQIPVPFTIPVSGGDGKLDGGWIVKAQSFGQNGYVVFVNGLIIQWGIGSVYNGGATYNNFPIAFPNACLQIVAVDVGWGCHSIGVSPISNAQFFAWSRDAAGNIPGVTGFRWIAIGF